MTRAWWTEAAPEHNPPCGEPFARVPWATAERSRPGSQFDANKSKYLQYKIENCRRRLTASRGDVKKHAPAVRCQPAECPHGRVPAR